MDTGVLIAALQQQSTYPHSTVQPISVITTAVSVIFLTGPFAYKINKPVNFGFLDFSTLEKRKKQCEDEFRYNRLLSPELYHNTITVTQENNHQLKINGAGEIIEYGIQMAQVDPTATMDNLLAKNQVTPGHIQKIAQLIAEFHHNAPTNQEIAQWGTIESVQFNWDENFEQTEKYIGTVITTEDFRLVQEKINNFIQKNTELFHKRVMENRIKHCHGDLHSGNIFIINDEQIYIFDRIVFNQRFPCSDVIADVAFLVMDLDFHGKQEFSQFLVEKYFQLTNDEHLPLLLPFYQCYRAYIRGKINSFLTEDTHLATEKRHEATEKAKHYFQLARTYAKAL